MQLEFSHLSEAFEQKFKIKTKPSWTEFNLEQVVYLHTYKTLNPQTLRHEINIALI